MDEHGGNYRSFHEVDPHQDCNSPSCCSLATIKLDISVSRSPTPSGAPKVDIIQHPVKSSPAALVDIGSGKRHSVMPTSSSMPLMDQDRPVYKGNIMNISPAYSFNFNVTDDKAETVDYLTIYNITDRPMAYKVKTTNPDSYRVRTSSGLIQARGSTNVFVYLQPGVMNVSRDKFLVMGLLIDDPQAKGSQLAQLWKTSPKDNSTFCDHKLWCNITMQDKPPKTDADRLMDRMDLLQTKEHRRDYDRYNDSSYDNMTQSEYERRNRRTRRKSRSKSARNQNRYGLGGGYTDREFTMEEDFCCSPRRSNGNWLMSWLLWPFSLFSSSGSDMEYRDMNGDYGGTDRHVDRVLAKQSATEQKLRYMTNMLVALGLVLCVFTALVGIEFMSDVGGKRPCMQ